MKAIVIPVEGTVEDVDFEGDAYQFIRKQVGGYIERVDDGKGINLWVNEDGIAEGLVLNTRASALAGVLTGYGYALFGNVVITREGDDEDGEVLAIDLTDQDKARLAMAMSLAGF
jgi:hypothetical protein